MFGFFGSFFGVVRWIWDNLLCGSAEVTVRFCGEGGSVGWGGRV